MKIANVIFNSHLLLFYFSLIHRIKNLGYGLNSILDFQI